MRVIFENRFENSIIYHEVNNYSPLLLERNTPIHNLKNYHEQIITFRDDEDNADLIERTILKYSKKSIGLQRERRYITFFTSSVDEFNFWYDESVNQIKLIKKLLNPKLQEDLRIKGLMVKVRVHPNIATKHESQQRYWTWLKNKFPDNIINFDEKHDSLNLCLESVVTSSIGSSLAAESLLLNIPHILIGDQNIYVNLRQHITSTEETFIDVLMSTLMINSTHNIEPLQDMCKKTISASLLYFHNAGEKFKFKTFGKSVNSGNNK